MEGLIAFLDWVKSHVDSIDDIRDVFYILIGIPALILLWWRSTSANRQAQAALEQAQAAHDQSVLAQADSLTNLFLSTTDMLGSEVVAVRIGGIHALMRLTEQRPEEFHIRVMQLLCAFLNSPPPHPAHLPPSERADIQTILQALKRRSDIALELEEKQRFYIYLTMAQLSGSALRASKFARSHFVQTDLSHAYAESSDFSHSYLDHCDLRHGRFTACNFFLAHIFNSNLSDSNFQAANFHRASIHFVDLSTSNLKYATLTQANLIAVNLKESELDMADLSGARIKTERKLKPSGKIDDKEVSCVLTQMQLDKAAADPARLPDIDSGILDAETGQQLVWNRECGKQNWERLESLRQVSRQSKPDK